MVKHNIHEIIKDWRQRNPQPTKKTEEYVKKWDFNANDENISLLEEFKKNVHIRDFYLIVFWLILAIICCLIEGNLLPFYTIFLFLLAMGIFSFLFSIIVGLILFGIFRSLCLTVMLNRRKKSEYIRKKIARYKMSKFIFRLWFFLWNIILSILTFSFVPKTFWFFKGRGGSFGAGGASGKI